MTNTGVPHAKKIHHFSPLRYPGGKAKLAPFIKRLMEANDLLDGEYVEPYAGGAGIGLELLAEEYVSRIHINDISRPLTAFWSAVLEQTEAFVRLVRNTSLTMRSWDRQKQVYAHEAEHDDLRVGFATFFLNRTSRSGILNGGVIGGRDQKGPWKIDARYNAAELVRRIESIARLKSRIELTRMDAVDFLRSRRDTLPAKTLIYLDPPYYDKGKDLYYDFYQPEDHVTIANFVKTEIKQQRWIVSYDNVKATRDIYADCPGISYGLGYSAREAKEGSEVMFFCDGLKVPPIMGAMFNRKGASRSVPALRSTRVF